MDSLVLALLVPNGPLKAWLSTALEPLPVRVFFEPWLPVDWGEFLDRLARLNVAAVLVDVDHFAADLHELAAQIKTIRPPSPAVIAVSTRTDHERESSFQAAGADNLVGPPFERTLVPLLEKLAADRPPQGAVSHSHGKLVGVIGARGGCGTTTFACMLALALRRLDGQQVLLADLDWNAGVAGFLMNAQTPYSLLDAATATHRLDWNYWKTLVATHSSGVDVIPAPAEHSLRQLTNSGRLRSVLRFTRACYSWVIADLGECWDGRYAEFADEFDWLWLVTTPDPAGLYLARRALRTLLQNGVDFKRIRLLVNRARRAVLGPDDVESLVGRRPDAWLPESAEVRAAAHGERPLHLPGRTGVRMLQLAARLAGKPEQEAPAPVALPALKIVRRAKFPPVLPRF